MSGIGPKQTKKIIKNYSHERSSKAIIAINKFRHEKLSHMDDYKDFPTDIKKITEEELKKLITVLTLYSDDTIQKLESLDGKFKWRWTLDTPIIILAHVCVTYWQARFKTIVHKKSGSDSFKSWMADHANAVIKNDNVIFQNRIIRKITGWIVAAINEDRDDIIKFLEEKWEELCPAILETTEEIKNQEKELHEMDEEALKKKLEEYEEMVKRVEEALKESKKEKTHS